MCNTKEIVFISPSDKEYTVKRTFMEVEIKAGGEQWVFHKSDQDPFPWPDVKIHGHYKYEKLNPKTGELYDVNTKKIVGHLKKKKLAQIQDVLKKSKDFKDYFI